VEVAEPLVLPLWRAVALELPESAGVELERFWAKRAIGRAKAKTARMEVTLDVFIQTHLRLPE
jgi:hypothetical protein